MHCIKSATASSPKQRPMQHSCSHYNAVRSSNSQTCTLSTHRTTPEHQMTTVMQPFQCDLQAQIPKHPITTHTQAHPKQLEATVTLRQKKRPTDPSRNRRTDEVPFIAACSHFTRKKTQGFALRLPPQNKAHATSCKPLQCGSQQQLANLHLSTHRTTPEHQMTTVMQPFQCDLQAQIPKHPITTHTQAHPKQLEATVTLRQKKNDQPTPAATAAHTRYLSSSPAANLHGKTQGFALRVLPKTKPMQHSCSHYNAVRSSNSQTCTLSTHRTTPEHQMTTVMQPFQCDLQAQIPKHPITTHTQAHPKQLEATVTLRQKKTDQPTPAATAAHTRYLSSSPAATLHGKTQGFRAPASSPKHSPCNIHAAIPMRSATLRHHFPSSPLPFLTTSLLPPLTFLTTSLRHHSPSSPLPFFTTSLRHHFPSPPLPFLTTSLRHHFPSSSLPFVTTSLLQPLPFLTTSLLDHFPSSPLPFATTSLPHHFPSPPLTFLTTSLPHHSPSSPLPFFTTSLRHHFPSSTTSLPHHFPSSPLPFITTSLLDHFPSSPLPFFTTSLRHHFASSPLPFFTTSLLHHFPSSPLPFVTTCSVKSHTTLHQGQFFSDVLLCSVTSHTTLHQGQVSIAHHPSSFQVSEFYLSVTRKYCFPTSFDK